MFTSCDACISLHELQRDVAVPLIFDIRTAILLFDMDFPPTSLYSFPETLYKSLFL